MTQKEEKNQSKHINWEMTEMIELAINNIKTSIIIITNMFNKLEKKIDHAK